VKSVPVAVNGYPRDYGCCDQICSQQYCGVAILGDAMKTPLVHVLVINWNGREHLSECFETLLASSYPNVRYVLIDNASTDGSVAFVRERYASDPRVEIVECPRNLGWSGGNNVGLRRALEVGADYVFLLNNDTATAPDAIEKLVTAAERNPRIGALAPKMLLYDEPRLLNSVGLACSVIGSSWDIGIGRLDGPQWDEPAPVIGVCGGACFLRADAVRRAGLLPEDFGIYLDDLDLCLRIWNAGYEVRKCAEAVVRHKFGATMEQGKATRRKYYLNTRNRLYVILRNFPLSKCFLVAAAVLTGECRAVGRAILDGEGWRVAAHVRAWLAGAAYVPRACKERAYRRRQGLGRCLFWVLVRTDCLFFGGTEFPKDGWYAARVVKGALVRPISACARLDVGEGRLRVTVMNCYPHLGRAVIDITSEGRLVATLETDGQVEQVLDVARGRVEFAAQRIFSADETGETFDIGGWIGVELP